MRCNPAAAGERLVGLVDHHQAVLAADRIDDALDHRVVQQVGRRVVGVGEVGQRGPMLSMAASMAASSSSKSARQRHADEMQALQLRRSSRTSRSPAAAPARVAPGTSQATASMSRSVRPSRCPASARTRPAADVRAPGHAAQIAPRARRVAVERHSAQALAQFAAAARAAARRGFPWRRA